MVSFTVSKRPFQLPSGAMPILSMKDLTTKQIVEPLSESTRVSFLATGDIRVTIIMGWRILRMALKLTDLSKLLSLNACWRGFWGPDWKCLTVGRSWPCL